MEKKKNREREKERERERERERVRKRKIWRERQEKGKCAQKKNNDEKERKKGRKKERKKEERVNTQTLLKKVKWIETLCLYGHVFYILPKSKLKKLYILFSLIIQFIPKYIDKDTLLKKKRKKIQREKKTQTEKNKTNKNKQINK